MTDLSSLDRDAIEAHIVGVMRRTINWEWEDVARNAVNAVLTFPSLPEASNSEREAIVSWLRKQGGSAIGLAEAIDHGEHLAPELTHLPLKQNSTATQGMLQGLSSASV